MEDITTVDIKHSTVQFIGGPRDGAVVRLRKSEEKEKHWTAQAERLYPSLYQDILFHVYELATVPVKGKKKRFVSRYVHLGMVEVGVSDE